MKTLRIVLAVLVVTVCGLGEVQAEITSNGLTPPRHGWGFAARAGGSFPTSDILQNNDSEAGPALNLQFYYSFKRILNVGVMAEYDRHRVEQNGFGETGDFQTLSLIPFVEGRVIVGQVSPYASFGLGVNINDFDESDKLNTFCGTTINCRVNPKNTVAARIAGGMDIFLNDHVALNLEVAWKSNKGDVKFRSNRTTVAEDKFKAHTIIGLVGVKFYFPSSK